jgi:hypothetical protein
MCGSSRGSWRKQTGGYLASPLTAWENFYIIIGSSAGALTGLTFVVVTLMQGVAGGRPTRSMSLALGAYTTPTIIHFGAALFICALLSAPWPALLPVALQVGLCGLAGIVYVGVVLRRIRQMEIYDPVLEDWVWYGILPLAAYAALVVAAIMLMDSATLALFGVGGALVLLMFIGIHNAWDAVTYIAIDLPQRSDGQQSAGQQDDRANDA